MKYWEYTDRDLIQKKLYILLPLQIFKFRKELERVSKTKSKDKINHLDAILDKAKEMAFSIMNYSKELYDSNEIYDSDFEKILLAVENLIKYINDRYVNNKKVQEEVVNMIRTLYDPLVEKKGQLKLAKESIIAILTDKFSVISDNIINTILSEDDVNTLKYWLVKVASLNSITEVEEIIGNKKTNDNI